MEVPVSLLGTIVAKVLALTEGILGEWADVSVGAAAGTPLLDESCYTAFTINASLTDCGAAFAATIVNVIEGVMDLIPQILMGVGANEVLTLV